jgi:hypothetical protein
MATQGVAALGTGCNDEVDGMTNDGTKITDTSTSRDGIAN